MMGVFFDSLDESIRRKGSKRESFPTIIMELLDVVIRVGNAQEVGRSDTLSGKKHFGRYFGSNKFKLAKRKWKTNYFFELK